MVVRLPFHFQTQSEHSNAGLVWYLDVHCINIFLSCQWNKLSMSEPSDWFVCVIQFRLFQYSNRTQIFCSYHLQKEQCSQNFRTRLVFAHIYSCLNQYFYLCLIFKKEYLYLQLHTFTYILAKKYASIYSFSLYLFILIHKYSFYCYNFTLIGICS
jgi:hypothetical protein